MKSQIAIARFYPFIDRDTILLQFLNIKNVEFFLITDSKTKAIEFNWNACPWSAYLFYNRKSINEDAALAIKVYSYIKFSLKKDLYHSHNGCFIVEIAFLYKLLRNSESEFSL